MVLKNYLFLLLFMLFLGCSSVNVNEGIIFEDKELDGVESFDDYERAVFSGGCFWCSEADFEKHEGVIEVISGYTGGDIENPTYKQVSAGSTGHREAVRVIYDDSIISYSELVDIYFKHIDPTDGEGSFVDRGFIYTYAIYTTDSSQNDVVKKYILDLESSGKFDKKIKVVTENYLNFYDAEDYHQDYYKKNPIRYKYYRGNSGRDDFIEKYWKEDNVVILFTDDELREKLTSLEYKVTQEDGTERPFDNEYWDNKEEGIYVDIVTEEALFSSTHKYVSGTGWPSFTEPITLSNIRLEEDKNLFTTRTEVSSKQANTHLGHVFDDGPKDKGGLRYCLNSASLKFVAKEDMKFLGYGEYLYLFE